MIDQAGLIGDDETLREPRLTLWTEFNQAWLTLLQRQKDLTQDDSSTLPSIRPPPPPQFVSLITLEDLWKMSKEVVRLADSVESHGLVDYELGIWEESIMESEFSDPYPYLIRSQVSFSQKYHERIELLGKWLAVTDYQ